MINSSIYIQSQQEVFDVVIVGAGPVGLVSACALADAGVPVTLDLPHGHLRADVGVFVEEVGFEEFEFGHGVGR